MSGSVGTGEEEEKVVVVAVRAEREISKSALAWALTHIVRPGDVVTLLAVLSDGEATRPGWRRWLWGFPRFSGSRKRWQQEGCQISASCSQMELQIDGHNKVNVRIKVVGASHSGVEEASSSGRGLVAAESKRVGANWIVLDKQLKQELKQCLEELQCNIVVMKGSRAEVLRLNLGGILNKVGPSLPPRCREKLPDPKLSSSPHDSSPKEKWCSVLSSSTVGFGGASTVFVHEQNPLFDGLIRNIGNLSSKEDANSEEEGSDCSRWRSPGTGTTTLLGLGFRQDGDHKDYNGFHREPASSPSPPLSAVAPEHNHDGVYWKHISLESPSIQSYRTYGGGGIRPPPTSVKECGYTSEVREAVSLFGSSPSNPPPLCSLCRHKAPTFGKPPRRFEYLELEKATDGFSDANFLGEGGHGFVHRGVLEDGQMVAVKQLKAAGDDAIDFLSEMESLSRAQHRNAVMLVGFCVEGKKRVLVYEYICNGSLDLHLHGREVMALDWDARVKIAVGAARGLRYLHEDCRVEFVVHGDVRPNNILLTHDFEPMVGDFSLTKRLRERSVSVDIHVARTFGYLAPEYIEYGVLTEKADVYAFGVVLLELLTGRRSMETAQPKGQQLLTEWARPLLLSLASEEGRTVAVDRFLDPRLGREQARYFSSQLRAMSCAASMCLRRDPQARPGMSKVLRVLEGDVGFLDQGGHDDRNSVGSRSSRMSHHLIRHYQDDEEEYINTATSGGSLSLRFPHKPAIRALYGEKSRTSHFY